MASDTAAINFGNFLRWKFADAGGVAYACRKVDLSVTTAERYFRGGDPGTLNIRQDNKDKLAAALGFADWTALDAAWRSTPMPPYPTKQLGATADPRLMTKAELESWMKSLTPRESLASSLAISRQTLAKLLAMKATDRGDADSKAFFDELIESMEKTIASLERMLKSPSIDGIFEKKDAGGPMKIDPAPLGNPSRPRQAAYKPPKPKPQK